MAHPRGLAARSMQACPAAANLRQRIGIQSMAPMISAAENRLRRSLTPPSLPIGSVVAGPFATSGYNLVESLAQTLAASRPTSARTASRSSSDARAST